MNSFKKSFLLGLLVSSLLIPAAFAGKSASKGATRGISSQACQSDADCGDLQYSESCRMIGNDNMVCDGKHNVTVQCSNGSCARTLSPCGECQWTKVPTPPDTCQSDAD